MILITNEQLSNPKSDAGSSSNYDVLCGKTNFANPGNEYFRQLVQIHREAYRSTSIRDEKRKIIDSVIHKIHSRGGRFLKTLGGDEISYAHQYEKVSHALRSARAPISASSVVRTKADLAGNVNSLLETQRRLYQQYCREANVDPFPVSPSKQEDAASIPQPLPAQQNEESIDEDALLEFLMLEE